MVSILLRTLCPGDPPEADELLDYFDSTYISGRLRQQKPAQDQAVRLVLRRSPPMFPPAIWNVHDATVNIWRGVKRKKLLSVLLSSKMPLVTHQLSVINRDMFSPRSVYRTYAETSLLARKPLPIFCVELGGTSDSITNISA